jgi:hypothetical protein
MVPTVSTILDPTHCDRIMHMQPSVTSVKVKTLVGLRVDFRIDGSVIFLFHN